MSLRNRLLLPVILSALAILAGCSSGTNTPIPPPSGGFSNTNFNGTYTFSVTGQDANGTFAMAGSFTACGCTGGTISGGSVDLDDPLLIAPGSTIASSSTYEITSDGRGQAKLDITNAAASLTTEVTVDFVLTSSSHGLIIRYDGGGTGSGTIDLQSSTLTQSSLNEAFAFSLSGTDLTANLNPLATVGAFTLDSSGNISTSGSTAGITDFNYNFAPSTQLALSGSVLIGSGTAPGTATLTSSFDDIPLTFDVYAIDSTHLKVIENDGQAIMVGDVFTQPSATITGNLVFNAAGYDTVGQAPFAVGGLMSATGTSISGAEDQNEDGVLDAGTTTPYTFGGSVNSTGFGRSEFVLTDFQGGEAFAAYPSSGGIFMLEIDSESGLNPTPGITSGVALPQSATSIAAAGYGFNLTGADANGELDEIAQFNATSTGLKGLLDENEGSATNTHNLSGSYNVTSNGTGTATLNSGLASMNFYVADASTVLFLSTDSGQVALGSFQTQTTPTNASNMAQQHLAMLRSVHTPHTNSRPRKALGHNK